MSDAQLAVVILAAGAGTRMKSALPKVLHPLAGVPMVAHVLATARALDPGTIATVVRHERDQVAAVIAEHLPHALIVDQDEIPGTGRAVEQALAALPADFAGEVLVLNGDVPLLSADVLAHTLEEHRKSGREATVLSAEFEDAAGYGRIVRSGSGAFTQIVEHKDASEDQLQIREINAGVYVFRADSLRESLSKISTSNAQGEKYLTDVIGFLVDRDSPVAAELVAHPWMVAGVNDRAQLSEQAQRLNAMIVRGWQLAGVTVVDPASTWIDVQVTLAEDVTIHPGTQLLGATKVETGASIGPDTTLLDCEVGAGANVKRTDGTLAVIGAGASVGPFAYLRPGTELGADGKIGTFVETKNAKIGQGSKVPHLSYVGDAEIGEGTNIGAGSIFANYDGQQKHHSRIGSHVRTGSHGVFVAPIEIGDGAYTGAGTVVRKNVPAGSLAISVAPQRNMDGWVGANRPGTAAAEAAEKAQDGNQPG